MVSAFLLLCAAANSRASADGRRDEDDLTNSPASSGDPSVLVARALWRARGHMPLSTGKCLRVEPLTDGSSSLGTHQRVPGFNLPSSRRDGAYHWVITSHPQTVCRACSEGASSAVGLELDAPRVRWIPLLDLESHGSAHRQATLTIRTRASLCAQPSLWSNGGLGGRGYDTIGGLFISISMVTCHVVGGGGARRRPRAVSSAWMSMTMSSGAAGSAFCLANREESWKSARWR